MPNETTTAQTFLEDAILEVTLSTWSETRLAAFLSTLQWDTEPTVHSFFYLSYQICRA